ncbi:RAMP superfamily CRISPR-associated protein [Alteromonas ponticola]|uniref:RAMP superfamily CRISPR-associated protein n=1 Tax=Alteromonas aquimaris TaxID=2998417 RepID=A0ABT3PA08_9ALTE|nr:RAMP superfamily CRISPR-associated protein [Alteromonas aquimaris]MCW8109607.1 RAMP superfamily CRISPR-associated protein [Alteromonas aquimaris]
MQIDLTVNFLSYWHVGTGLGEGAAHDASVQKDENGLPYFPGKALKGLLRNATQKALQLGWFEQEPSILETIFGTSHLDSQENRLTKAGCLYVSSATLNDQDAKTLAQPEFAEARNNLYRTLSSTAISEESGTAIDGSLRAMEVTIPLRLHASLEIDEQQVDGNAEHIYSVLKESLSLIENIGAKRSRGLGRVALNMEVRHAN